MRRSPAHEEQSQTRCSMSPDEPEKVQIAMMSMVCNRKRFSVMFARGNRFGRFEQPHGVALLLMGCGPEDAAALWRPTRRASLWALLPPHRVQYFCFWSRLLGDCFWSRWLGDCFRSLLTRGLFWVPADTGTVFGPCWNVWLCSAPAGRRSYVQSLLACGANFVQGIYFCHCWH